MRRIRRCMRAVVFATDAAQVKAMKENLGKTYIVGAGDGD